MTWAKSSANSTCFTWDHGRFSQTFAHSANGLPELSVNTGTCSFYNYCTQINQYYNNAVAYAFATAIEYDDDELEDPSNDNVDKFQSGVSVYYKSCDGNNESAKYLHKKINNGTELHHIWLGNGDDIVTTGGHIQLLEQPGLTNIPTNITSYCKEVGHGHMKEDIEQVACLEPLSPLQQDSFIGTIVFLMCHSIGWSN